VNAQVPFDLTIGEYRMVIRRADLVSAPAGLGVGTASPAIATVNNSGSGQGHVWRVGTGGGFALANTENAAREGETVVIFCTGLGATNPFFSEGLTVPAQNRINVTSQVQVQIGGKSAAVSDAYLAPGYIGVYLVWAVVPSEVEKGGAVQVIVRGDGVDSQPVTMAIQ
jgi:uncharacterized protein (TIGR03437 family)